MADITNMGEVDLWDLDRVLRVCRLDDMIVLTVRQLLGLAETGFAKDDLSGGEDDNDWVLVSPALLETHEHIAELATSLLEALGHTVASPDNEHCDLDQVVVALTSAIAARTPL